ncbi:ferrous iron transport protein A [Gemmatimonas aurantiaca]|nr:ferrous iron transport protein A [Gemmatimonas aurantiaca]
MTKLSEAQRGEQYRVISVDEGVSGRRLVEMGVYPGRTITLVRRAPFRDPIEYQVGECSLSMRACEAELVSIESV